MWSELKWSEVKWLGSEVTSQVKWGEVYETQDWKEQEQTAENHHGDFLTKESRREEGTISIFIFFLDLFLFCKMVAYISN